MKAENAKLENETLTDPQEVEEELEEEAVEVESEESEEVAEPEEDEAEETEIESWMQGDDQTSDAEKKFTDSDIGAAKKKLKAKLESKHNTEVEQLKAEIEQLRNAGTQVVAQTPTQPPKREDFYDNDDPESAYIDALTDWKINNSQSKAQEAELRRAQEARLQQRKAEVDSSVDRHYERAAKLSAESGIAAETYQASDLVVRTTIDSLFPGKGDAITDEFIDLLGEGSEKVLYNLGVNKSRRDQFKTLLQNDPSGLKAGMYLAELKAELSAPSKRKTRAPKPAPNLKGDTNTSSSATALEKKYKAAHKKGDVSEAFKIKREAKKQGVNTNSW